MLEAYIESSNRAQNEEQLFFELTEALAKVGFDRVLYSLLSDHPSMGLKEGHGVLRNYPDDWVKYYSEKSYYDYDPVVRTARNSPMPFVWQNLPKQLNYSKTQSVLMHEANEAGLRDGVAIPLHGPGGEAAGVGMASSAGGVEINPNLVSNIDLMCRQFHLCFRKFHTPQSPLGKIALSGKEMDILYWCWRSKSIPCIATIMNVSPNTVKFHLKNIYEKLHVGDKQMAVLHAIKLGLIQP